MPIIDIIIRDFTLLKDLVKMIPEQKHSLSDDMFERCRGVYAPQIEWLRGRMADFVIHTLNTQKFKKVRSFDVNAVQKSFDNCLIPGAENSFYTRQWVNSARWFEVFKVRL